MAFELPLAGSGLPTEAGVPYIGTKDNNNRIAVGAGMYWKNASGVWVPVSVADPIPTRMSNGVNQAQVNADGSLPVQLTGRKAQLSIVSQNPATTVPAGGSESISIIATSGYLAKLQHIYFQVPAPNGATSGYHKLIIGIGDTLSASRIYEVQASYNQTLAFSFGALGNGNTLIQPTDMAQVLNYRTGGIYYGASGKHLSLVYYNHTNVDQTNARLLKVIP